MPAMIRPRRVVPRLHYTLLMCGFRGHEFVGTDAEKLRERDTVFAHDEAGVRWYRCLRCDSWLPHSPPTSPTREYPPLQQEIALPLRGRPLRDLFVLRAIAVIRAFKGLFLLALAAGIFVFAANSVTLRDTFYRVIAELEGQVVTEIEGRHHGVVGLIEKLLSYDSSQLNIFAAAVIAYAAVNFLEAIGLWNDRRWGEYLTFCAVTAFIPLEIYELTLSITVIKIAAVVINIGICAYLLFVKRLFGVRGGYAALMVAHHEEVSWEVLERATPGHPGWRAPFD